MSRHPRTLLSAFLFAPLLTSHAALGFGDDDKRPIRPKAADVARAEFDVTKRTREVSADEYRANIAFLASDELQGRGIGTEGIDRAADYIADQFKKAGLKPGGADGDWFQPFDLNLWREIDKDTSVAWTSGDKDSKAAALKLKRDYVPMPFSFSGKFSGGVVFVGYGAIDSDAGYDDYDGVNVKGKVVLMLRYEPKFLLPNKDRPNTHSRHAQFSEKCDNANGEGASGILVVNPVGEDEDDDELYAFGNGAGGQAYDLPMVHITRKTADKLLRAGGLDTVEELQARIEKTQKPASASLKDVSVTGRVKLKKTGPMVKNVIGVFPGSGPNKDEYIVIGGHYDHLGKSISLFGSHAGPGAKPMIHNGADDNASGSSGVIEVAKLIGHGPPTNRSIICMTFTAEESGLLGSHHFCEHPTVPLDKIAAMINMDMIGRMRKDMLEVGGMKTGEGLKPLVERLGEQYGFDIRDGGGGRGPSDHASFFAKNIPVLFLFTGLHPQYHQPEDDTDLINAADGARVAQMACDIAYEISSWRNRPRFRKDTTPEQLLNPDQEKGRTARRSRDARDSAPAQAQGAPIRLGVQVRIDDDDDSLIVMGIEDDSPAARAGVKADDRILKIDGKAVEDLEQLRSAISRFKAGGSATLIVKRGEQELKLRVSFARTRPEKPAPKPDKVEADHAHAGERSEAERPMPKVRMGVAPSYGSDNKDGMAIEFVSKDGPADKAGMHDSDVILAIAGHKVKDIYTYMDALNKCKPGQEVVVTVLRDGSRVDLKVTLDAAAPRGRE